MSTESAPVPAHPPVPSSELRTFLIADVRGYTRFTQEYGDEAAAQLATRFAALMREGVAARGGRVLELRGDEALAVFGSARQALCAALALQARFAHEREAEPTLPLAVGMGLDAGEAVPVEAGYRGGALNLAARLCSLAEPGEVLASEAVMHLAGKTPGLAYRGRGPVQLKGLAEPVVAVQVVPEAAPPAAQRLAQATGAAEEGAGVPRVYICYAHRDQAVVARLSADLQASGVLTWTDERSLRPGTRNWEQAVRAAIRSAPLVLLLASPKTPLARYVLDELRVAEMYGRPVCPVWVAGEHWMECVPLGWGGAQYIDARGARYETAVQQIVAAAQDLCGREGPRPGPERPVPLPLPVRRPRNPYKGLRASVLR
jgi:class 3 adenylate cyclase